MKCNVWAFALIVVISLCRIGMGLYNGLPGPTLLYLSDNVNVSVAAISTVFSANAIGNSFGAIMGGIVKRLVKPDFRHLFVLGSGLGIMACAYATIPWITNFWVLICDITLSGLMYGYVEAGLQAILLQLWGQKASRPYIQLFHFMYSIGAFAAPLIAEPFQAQASNQVPADDRCPNFEKNVIFTTAQTPTLNSTEIELSSQTEFNPVGWAFIAASAWLLIVSIIMIILSYLNIEKHVLTRVENQGVSYEARKEEPFLDVAWLFLFSLGYFFCSVTTTNVFYNFIYSISLCSDLQFTVEEASRINSIFWLGIGLGRLSGIVASNFFKPRSIVITCLIGAITDMVIMCIWGEKTPWVAWAVSGVHGYTTSVLFPSGISWLSQITNMSGTYMFIFNLGNAVGTLSMLPLAGYLFDLEPFNVIYLCLALSIGAAVIFICCLYVGKRHKEFVVRKALDEEKEENECDESKFQI